MRALKQSWQFDICRIIIAIQTKDVRIRKLTDKRCHQLLTNASRKNKIWFKQEKCSSSSVVESFPFFIAARRWKQLLSQRMNCRKRADNRMLSPVSHTALETIWLSVVRSHVSQLRKMMKCHRYFTLNGLAKLPICWWNLHLFSLALDYGKIYC